MSVAALGQQIQGIERRGYFRVDDARRLTSQPVVGRHLSVEEHAVLVLFKDRIDDRSLGSSYQARSVLDRAVAAGPTSALADGAAVALGAAKSGVKFGVLGALLGGIGAAIISSMNGHHGPWAELAAQHAFGTGVQVGAVVGGTAGAFKGAQQVKKERD